MAFQRPGPEILELFERVAPGPPIAVAKKMFGMPCRFANERLFMGVFEQSIMLRLAPEAREELLRMPGAALFQPGEGMTMSEYVVLPEALLERPRDLAPWIARALSFVQAMPPKPPKKPKAPKNPKPARKPEAPKPAPGKATTG